MARRKLRAAVLGATGAVGQRFVERLARHPWFEIAHVAASPRSQGKAYGDACRWRLQSPQPAAVAEREVSDLTPRGHIDLAFSALSADVAGDVETAWSEAGIPVFSNARNFRMEPDVPLLVPEVNPDHLGISASQSSRRGWAESALLVTNPNCSATFLTMALAPLHRAFGVEHVIVVTMQAISGAGYPGVSALDISGNVIPFIEGEEEKLEIETRKMLGTCDDGSVRPAGMTISAHVNRVPVLDGHLESVSVKLRDPVGIEDVHEALSTFTAEPQHSKLPSAPRNPIVVMREPDRPQPRLDATSDDGMVTYVGGLRPCSVLDVKMTVLGHNTVRGAAGGSILNAELAVARGMLGDVR